MSSIIISIINIGIIIIIIIIILIIIIIIITMMMIIIIIFIIIVGRAAEPRAPERRPLPWQPSAGLSAWALGGDLFISYYVILCYIILYHIISYYIILYCLILYCLRERDPRPRPSVCLEGAKGVPRNGCHEWQLVRLCSTLNSLHAQTLMLTDAQNPFLGTPLAPLEGLGCERGFRRNILQGQREG